MDPEELRSSLRACRLAGPIEYHPTIASTNDRALVLARAGNEEGTLVVADTQTRGKGRLGRTWLDRPGDCLLFSLVLRPRIDRSKYPLLGLASAVACARACNEIAHVPVHTKWPNDVVCVVGRGEDDDRPTLVKLGGVLLEATEGGVIVGIGINVRSAPEIPADTGAVAAGSLSQICARELRRPQLLASVLLHLEGLYADLNAGEGLDVVAAFRELDITLGMTVTLTTGNIKLTAKVRDISPEGALVADTELGRRRFLAGDVSMHARPPGTTTDDH